MKKRIAFCMASVAALCAVPGSMTPVQASSCFEREWLITPQAIKLVRQGPCQFHTSNNIDPAWTAAQGVDTSVLPVPSFRIIDADVPVEWYAIPGLTFTTQIDVDSTAPLPKTEQTFFGPWQAVWSRGLEQGAYRIGQAAANGIGASIRGVLPQ